MSTDLPMQPTPAELTSGSTNGNGLYHHRAGSAVDLGVAEQPGGGTTGPSRVLSRYLSTVRRFKWLIALIMVAGTAVGFAASRMVKPTYLVQARLWFDGNSGPSGPIGDDKLLNSSSWTELLNSYAVLDFVVEKERLYLEVDPPSEGAFANFKVKERFLPGEYHVILGENGRTVTLETAAGALIERAARGDSLGRSVGFSWVPNVDALRRIKDARFSVKRPRDRARELGGKLVTRMGKGGSFMTLELRGPDPNKTASTLNTTVQRFVDLAGELKSSRLQEFAHTLDEQLRVAQQNLQSAEIGLESFRVSTITQPTESPLAVPAGIQSTTSPAMNGFVGLKVQEDQIQQDRAALGRALARDGEISTTELEAIGAVQGSPELKAALNELASKRAALRALQYKYTDEYSGVKSLRSEIQTLEIETIPTQVRQLVGELTRREVQVASLISATSSELRQIPPRVMEEARLRRQVAIADNLYTMLRSRHEEARLAALGSSPDLRVIDRAIPPHKPLKDERNQMILLGFGASLGLVAVGVLLLDKLDRRVRFPEEVTSGLRLPILAAIPRLKGGANGNRDAENTSHVIEAFRGLRLTLLQERGTQGCLVTAISSPGSGDGKSFIAVNLAFALADQGYRTLLIDGDIRRGGLHHFLGCSRKPGLTDLLAGTATRDRVIQQTSYPLLDLLACGRRLQGGPELLGSAGLGQYIREFKSQYAVIIIDTPPLGAGIDPFVLGMAAGNLALVLRTGLSDMEFTEAKLSVLDRLPVRILGAILNGVPAGGAYRYYGYIAGYESADEEVTPATPALPVLG